MSKMCNFSTPNECDQSLPSNRSGIPVMWARFNYYLATGDKQELGILRQDINNYADSNKAKLIQNNSWDCKLMIDLGKSEIFSDEEKNKIEKICFDSLYEFDSYLGRMSFEKNLDSVINLEDLKGNVQKNLSIALDRKPKDSINPQYKSTINGNATYLKQNAMYISDYATRGQCPADAANYNDTMEHCNVLVLKNRIVAERLIIVSEQIIQTLTAVEIVPGPNRHRPRGTTGAPVRDVLKPERAIQFAAEHAPDQTAHLVVTVQDRTAVADRLTAECFHRPRQSVCAIAVQVHR